MCQAYEAEHAFVIMMERNQPWCSICHYQRASFIWNRGMCDACDSNWCKENNRTEAEHRQLYGVNTDMEFIQRLWTPPKHEQPTYE